MPIILGFKTGSLVKSGKSDYFSNCQRVIRQLVCVLVLYQITPIAVQADEIVVGMSADVHLDTLPPTHALQAAFGMRSRTWPNGTPIKVFVLPDNHATHIAFCKQILHVFPYQMRAAWDRLVFSGTGNAPTEVDSEEAMRTALASTPGAIGYLHKSLVGDGIVVIATTKSD